LRFDDMLATVLAQSLPTEAARAAAWRQVVDVLAQGRVGSDELAGQAFDFLRDIRDEVPHAVRVEVARAFVGRKIPAELVAFFAEEPPSIAAPLIGKAVLEADEWLALLPTLTPTARGLLRHRRDLPREVVRALGTFGASDFVISAPAAMAEMLDELSAMAAPTPSPTIPLSPEAADLPPAPTSPLVDGERQIRDLLSRIQAFRERGPSRPLSTPAPAAEPSAIENFRFETGADGIIIWVEGAPRGPLIGESIAIAASSVDHGVDGHAAGAYRRRAPFRDARLSIAGGGAIGGEWRISAVPFFEPSDGRFTGYRGTARRPRADETAVSPAVETGLFGSGIEPDSLRQLVHELRTPLNAIVGFSEMIEQQYVGPAAAGYRARAADIIAQGRRLLAAVDDLDMAARLESRTPPSRDDGAVDASAVLSRLHADYLPIADARGVSLNFRIATDLPPLHADAVAVERMFARLLAATIATASPEERVKVDLTREGDRPGALLLAIARPRLLIGRDERLLLDPGYNPDGDWPDGDWPDAPVLGLGFALRLVRNLAMAAGGGLTITADRFLLRLPVGQETAQAGEGGG
jgi:signal transduction histidine kinase